MDEGRIGLSLSSRHFIFTATSEAITCIALWSSPLRFLSILLVQFRSEVINQDGEDVRTRLHGRPGSTALRQGSFRVHFLGIGGLLRLLDRLPVLLGAGQQHVQVRTLSSICTRFHARFSPLSSILSAILSCSWHDLAMVHENHHMKRAIKKGKPYEFKVSFLHAHFCRV